MVLHVLNEHRDITCVDFNVRGRGAKVTNSMWSQQSCFDLHLLWC